RWKAKLCCEFSESRGSAHPRLSERYLQFLLSFFCHRLIVVKNARHHDRRTKIVSHPACTSEHMPDGMAGSHRYPSLQANRAEPGSDLALGSDCNIRRLARDRGSILVISAMPRS